jgi:hypothetical protein
MKKIFFILFIIILKINNLYSQNSSWTSTSGFLTNYPLTSKIGIGTNTPSHPLHVNGNLLVTDKFFVKNKLILGRDGIDNTKPFYISISNEPNYSFNTFDFTGSLVFRRLDSQGNNIGSILNLQSDGTITIGVWENYKNLVNNTMGYSLMVNGGILAEKMKIVSDVPTSDFVFEEDYKLLSLKEVESFVKKYKHLPEVPSAQEFKENGYNVGEMDDLLLRKVEELTLYMIELKKENEMLKLKLEELEKQR